MRRMFLLAVIALFGNATAQPDTVWSRQLQQADMTTLTVLKVDDGFLIGG